RRKKGTDLNVGEEVRAHAIENCCAYQLRCSRSRYRSPSTFSKNRRKAREQLGLARSGTVHPLRVSRWQRTNIAIECERFGHAAEQVEPYEPSRLRVSRDAIAREQRLDLRCKTERPTVIGSVKRLDTVSVTREKQATAFCVPNRECKHAAQTLHHLGAVM